MGNMGFDFGLEGDALLCKREFRYLFKIDGISAQGVNALPPLKSSRPNISFKEMEVKHLNEHVYYPAKPDWKPITLTLYDVSRTVHPVFQWLEEVYVPRDGSWRPSTSGDFIKTADLELYDGCGTIVEKWVYENVWPSGVNFQTLDMNGSSIMQCDITLRYARAYID